jgi:hypothetical protein
LRERERGVYLVLLHNRQDANCSENCRQSFAVVRNLNVEPWGSITFDLIRELFVDVEIAILIDDGFLNAAHLHASCGIQPPCIKKLIKVVKNSGGVS